MWCGDIKSKHYALLIVLCYLCDTDMVFTAEQISYKDCWKVMTHTGVCQSEQMKLRKNSERNVVLWEGKRKTDGGERERESESRSVRVAPAGPRAVQRHTSFTQGQKKLSG